MGSPPSTTSFTSRLKTLSGEHAELYQLSEVGTGPHLTLNLLFGSFRARRDAFRELDNKKDSPGTYLARCEWSHDDYSLQVENLPKAPPAPGQMDAFETNPA